MFVLRLGFGLGVPPWLRSSEEHFPTEVAEIKWRRDAICPR